MAVALVEAFLGRWQEGRWVGPGGGAEFWREDGVSGGEELRGGAYKDVGDRISHAAHGEGDLAYLPDVRPVVWVGLEHVAWGHIRIQSSTGRYKLTDMMIVSCWCR